MKFMQRNRIDTENRLLDAVGELIATNGFNQIGINRISSYSGINKVLIYRYFGGLEGLLQAYFDRNRPIISKPYIDVEYLKGAPVDEVFDACYEYLIDEFRALRKNPEAQMFLRASLLNNGVRSRVLAIEKKEELYKKIDRLGEIVGSPNARPFAAVLISSMLFLTFMGQQKRIIMDIDLNSDEGWAQIEGVLKNIFRGSYLSLKERKEKSVKEES